MLTATQRLGALLDFPTSDEDRKRAALLLLDWTGCAVAGQKEPAGQKITTAFADETGPCTRIGANTASPLMAALHNGCLGNVLEMDDVDKRAILHAAPTIIPAALAMAQYTGANSSDFLDAIIIGYEATIRIGRAVGPGHYAFWHNTATCGPFGAAAAACHLLAGSDLVSAMGLAGTQAAGLWQTRHEGDSMAKQLHAGHAAHAGVLAAMLSAQGFQGPRSILDGEQGFFAAMCPDGDIETIFKDYGGGRLIHQTSIKPYASCRHAHPAIDAALMAELEDGPIRVETYSDALKFCDQPHPETINEAKFSIQHCVAVALLNGAAPQFKDFEPEAINDADVKAIRGRISLAQTEFFNREYPGRYGAAVIIGGKRFFVTDALGDPENPLIDIDDLQADLGSGTVFDLAVDLLLHSGMGLENAMSLSTACLELRSGAKMKTFTDLLP